MEVFNGHNKLGVVPWPRQFVAILSLYKPGCCADQSLWDLQWIKWPWEVYFWVIPVFTVSIAPPVHDTHSLIYHQCYAIYTNKNGLK